MRKAESRSAGLLCVGCCLALACWGCIHPHHVQRDIALDDWSWEPDQLSWAEDLGLGEEEPSKPQRASAAESGPRPNDNAEDSDWTVPEALSPEKAACGDSCQPVSCDSPATVEQPTRRSPIRSALASLWSPLLARIDVRRYRAPRFHPVPLQSVFLPRVGETPRAGFGEIPGDGHLPATPPEEASPPVEVVLPSPPPPETSMPQVEAEKPDRVTGLQRPPETASRPGSWIYSLIPDRRSAAQPLSVKRGSGMNYGR